MKRAAMLTVVLSVVVGLMLVLPASGLAGGGKATITGTIHCIDNSGKMHTKAGVCPADHIAHVIITDDGRAVMLGGGKKMEKLVRELSFPAGTKVKAMGKMSDELNAMELEELIIGVGAAGN